MKIFFITAIICACWLVFAQSCMRMRTTDNAAREDFAKHNVPFTPAFFSTGNTNLHYVVTGSDSLPTLFFVHGSPGSWDAFAGYLKDSLLRTRYRMISIDRPGFGYSNFGDALNLEEQGKAISALLAHIQNGKPVCLIGHSLGGPMVVKLAADNPNAHISNLVILAGSVDPAEEKPENWRVPFDRTVLRYMIPGAMRPSNAELLMFKKDVEEMPKDLASITCKVLIMHGSKDALVPPANADYAKAHLIKAKEVQLVWFEGENHFIPWTKFADIRNALYTLDMYD